MLFFTEYLTLSNCVNPKQEPSLHSSDVVGSRVTFYCSSTIGGLGVEGGEGRTVAIGLCNTLGRFGLICSHEYTEVKLL